MKKVIHILFIILATIHSVTAQNVWGTKGSYLTKNGEPVYLNGVNYIVSDGWMINLPNLSRESASTDMEALEKIGINHIRFFPMWQLTQPTIDHVDENVLKQLDMLVESAREHNISMQIAPLTGWMSGAVFLPPWAVGDMFRDSKIINGEEFLCKTIATRYQENKNVLGYDFGNEMNVLQEKFTSGASGDQIYSWMKQIYRAFKNNSKSKLITNGIGTGYNINFDVRNIAKTTDYLSPHSYPYFHGTYKLDPWFGQRNTYSPNFIISWCKTIGKPVVLQEFGCSEAWLPPSKVGTYLRLTYFSTWADGAAGFIWWGSHDIDTTFRVKSKDMLIQYSAPNFAHGKFEKLEYNLGLLSHQNVPKESALSFSDCINTANKLGLSWIDNLPVCYIIIPDNKSFNTAMHQFITAYTLAKQAHFNVKLCFEGTPIPSEAKAVFIPGLKLSGYAKEAIQNYLVNGGTVYQSYENDFGKSISLGEDTIIDNPSFFVNERFGLTEIGQPVYIPVPISFRAITVHEPAIPLVSYMSEEKKSVMKHVFVKQPVGKGTYYYFAGNLEESLVKTYNPWDKTNCEQLYNALKPQTSINIDNKYVELFFKHNENQSLILLLNHSEKYQHTTLKSHDNISLTNFETREEIGKGKEITLLLKPAEVIIAMVKN
jgi:hypothetical protein